MGGLVLGDEPGRAGVARRDRPDLDADSPGDLVAVDPLHGREIVTSLQQANAPDAVPDYVVPGASLGYTPGYGEAFQVTPSSADGNPVRFEVTIICAIRDGYAICAYAVGPQVSLGRLVTHPTEARLALALWADPQLNGVRWKGQGLPLGFCTRLRDVTFRRARHREIARRRMT